MATSSWKTFVLLIAVVGSVALGVGLYTFVYAKGYSYLTSDPAACANCHIMREQYEAWEKSSHRLAARCNDCHAPHDIFGKYKTKATNGFWHSYAFTTGDFHEPIRIKQSNREVTEGACRSCHASVTESIEGHGPGQLQQTQCTSCHNSVGHAH